jgi:RimJ/RimL family protein N-acetyltransferase
MLNQHEISIKEHISWFYRVSQSTDIELLVLEINDECCGLVQFKDSNYLGVVDWGFYVAPDAPKGTGRKLGLAALNHAFKKENLHKVCGQTLHWNQSSIELHKSLGFVQEGILRDQHFDGAGYHDLIYFGILKSDWVTKESLAGITK